ncbi:hypothetical protein CRYUN_Cryun40dG0078800 [Craigia yunnanensis]
MKRLEECIEELTKFTLQSHINKFLNFELRLSPEFCSNLLIDSHPADPNSDIFKGVPSYPLYKHLALALHQSIVSGFFCSRQANSALLRDEISTKQKEEWNKLVSNKGLELINIMNHIDFELHVQELFFSMLRDGLKTNEGRMFIVMLHFLRCYKLKVFLKSFLELNPLKKACKYIGNFIQRRRKGLMASLQSVFLISWLSLLSCWPTYYLN